MKELIILGIRGLPAQHGGFETFAEHLCKYLIERNWEVIVYCQEEGAGPIYESEWQRARRIHIPVKGNRAFSTIVFDLRSTIHSLRHRGVYLTLGYNTALFNVLHRLFRKTNVINMDGIEWKRQKWGAAAKVWFWMNERFGCWLGNQLIADHPKIEDHLATRVSRKKITMIPYGGAQVSTASDEALTNYSLSPEEYAIVVARAEPENSILDIVQGFSTSRRGRKLVILGNYDRSNPYQNKVMKAASNEVIFLGAIYDTEIVSALRFHARVYVHGHQVGGTNPSLVEALGAGNAIIAHDNPFNRWVAKDGAIYASDAAAFSKAFTQIFEDDELYLSLKRNTSSNFQHNFKWGAILEDYENLLAEIYPDN
ncbi:glycosyltransferase involved in cell wall biosynthesis [Litorivivens lipolytica]|uniref:Glycosyltransferase involved in cell wall biosynthesis n=1 Tax=Litorivivens lipolytica TaxID=1524264 RepID=A0A7W4W898_9GAMM|nr:glycosyltransferase involved in cell wall biosynthesis [Litorivivens lipolytica]